MRAVVVAILPDLPDQDQAAFDQAMYGTAKALGAIQPQPVDMIACIKEMADAVIEAVGR